MCTAITYHTKDHYFGRNLDLEHSYDEEVTITPRCFPLSFRNVKSLTKHYAMIGMATISDRYPLYYDATNEAGLSMAGLNFPGNAVYLQPHSSKENIAPFELIPWILGQCATVAEARKFLENINIANIPFSKEFPTTPLHWMIADHVQSITIEPMADGLHIYENPVGVLTNNPPFDYHLQNLNNYLNLTREEPKNRFAPEYALTPHSRGLGAFGLPGDLSSASRFVKAAFTKLNSVSGDTEAESVSQFFHILSSVSQQNGCVRVGDSFEKTVYTSCCNIDKGIYCYTTYENCQITAVDMHRDDLNSYQLYHYPIIRTQQIHQAN